MCLWRRCVHTFAMRADLAAKAACDGTEIMMVCCVGRFALSHVRVARPRSDEVTFAAVRLEGCWLSSGRRLSMQAKSWGTAYMCCTQIALLVRVISCRRDVALVHAM